MQKKASFEESFLAQGKKLKAWKKAHREARTKKRSSTTARTIGGSRRAKAWKKAMVSSEKSHGQGPSLSHGPFWKRLEAHHWLHQKNGKDFPRWASRCDFGAGKGGHGGGHNKGKHERKKRRFSQKCRLNAWKKAYTFLTGQGLKEGH